MSICLGCDRQRETLPGAQPEALSTATFDAFPSGVPKEIWIGLFGHRRPFPGDGGISFEGDVPLQFIHLLERRAAMGIAEDA